MSILKNDRLSYSGPIDEVLRRACGIYYIGKFITAKIIPVGYEDCNVFLNTSTDKYVAKIFSKERTPQQISRYVSIIDAAVKAGVNHPEIYTAKNGKTTYTDKETGLSMVMMKFIDGKTFFEMKRTPDKKELALIAEEAAKINKVKLNPSYLFDSWAIPNISATYSKVKQYMARADIEMVEKVISKYNEIPLNKLPRCLVHGDFTKANIMKGKGGKIYILDFSVSNIYPRIQELAVIAANLMHDDKTSLKSRCKMVIDAYSKWNKLTELEKKYLYSYALAGVAMEFLGAHQEKFIKGNNTKETDFWLRLGRDGLRKEIKTINKKTM